MLDRMKNPAIVQFFLSLLIIAGVEILLFRHGIRWWYGDDPTILKIAIRHNFYDMFFSPAAYREMTSSNFTPFAFALFRLDYLIFGLSPAFFYFHLYTVFYLAAVLFYFSCRVRFSSAGSLTAVLFFMITLPVLESGSLLMQRHYTEGLLFALCSFLFFDRYMRTGKKSSLLAAALFFFIASLCKEIFVPLPFVFIFFPYRKNHLSSFAETEVKAETDNRIRENVLFKVVKLVKSDIIFQRRIVIFIPCFFLLLIYAIWRTIMLAGVGGYGLHLNLHEMLFLPINLLTLVGGSGKFFIISVLIMCVCFFILAGLKEKMFAVVLVFMAAAPVVPVISLMEIRYALLSALCTAVLSGWCFDMCFKTDSLNSRKNNISKVWFSALIMFCTVSMIICTVSMFKNNINSWLPVFRHSRHKAMVEGRYLLEKGTDRDFIRGVDKMPVFFSGLGWLRMNILKLEHGPRPLFDWFQLFHKSGYRILQFDEKSYGLVVVSDLKKDMENFDRAFARKLNMKKPLKLKLEYSEPVVKWEFGPWDNGQYTLFFEDYYPEFVPLPKKGQFPLKFDKNVFIRLKFKSNKGWVTYSPVEAFNCKNGRASLMWQRK